MGAPVSQLDVEEDDDDGQKSKRRSLSVRLSRQLEGFHLRDRRLSSFGSRRTRTPRKRKRWKRTPSPERNTSASPRPTDETDRQHKQSENLPIGSSLCYERESPCSQCAAGKESQSESGQECDSDKPAPGAVIEDNDSIWTVSSFSSGTSLPASKVALHGGSRDLPSHFPALQSSVENVDACSLTFSDRFSDTSLNRSEIDDACSVLVQLVESIAQSRITQVRNELKEHLKGLTRFSTSELCDMQGNLDVQFPGGGRATFAYTCPPLVVRPVLYESEAFPRVGVVKMEFDFETLRRMDGKTSRNQSNGSLPTNRRYSSANFIPRAPTPEVKKYFKEI